MLKRDDDNGDDFLAFPCFLSIKLHHSLLLWSLSLQNFENPVWVNVSALDGHSGHKPDYLSPNSGLKELCLKRRAYKI